MSSKQFPLQCPAGWKRTQEPERSRFEPHSASSEGYRIFKELERLGATSIVISSNMEYKSDGTPYARQLHLNDTGVAVYFYLDGEEQCIPCDKWISVEENMRAIWKTVEALRGLERWGAKDMVNAAFRGFKALPGAIVTPERQHRSWFVVLGIDENSNALEVKAAYRKALKLHHPDVGGDPRDFQEVQNAYNEWAKL